MAKALKTRSIFDYSDYRAYLADYLEDKPRGEAGRLSRALNISSSLMSLILKGAKNLTSEQAVEVTEYLSLAELEGEYFMTLADLGRAGTAKLQSRLKKKMSTLREQSRKIAKRVDKDKELSDEALSIYYSSWLYTGIRNYVSIGSHVTAQQVAQKFSISPHSLQQVLKFCIEQGLIKHFGDGYTYNLKSTHIGADSPWVNQHHRNWRSKGFEQMESRRDTDLFYTCPMSLSHEAAEKIRELLPEFIQQVLKIVGPSKSEKVMCWNMDWFEY